MNWDHLRFFLAVAETGSLQGAARRLAVNHSTVFRRIQQFEKEADCRLFDRLPEGYQLTAAGEALHAHARRIGNEVDQLQLKLMGRDFRPHGTIRLTAPDNLAYRFLPAYLQAFSNRYPEIDIELVVGAESLDLTRREADIALRATPSPPEHLIGRRVATLRWGCFAAESYLERQGRPRHAEALGEQRLIGADGALRRLPPFRHLDRSYPHNQPLRCSTLNAMSAMAEAGQGIALLPDDQIKPLLVRLFDTAPPFHTELWLLTHPELRRTERIRLLMEHLSDSIRHDPRLAEPCD